MAVYVTTIIVVASIFQLTSSVKYEFEEYTREAKAFDGTQCLTGCSPVDNECVVNWKWNKKSCQVYAPAPVYFTSRYKDPNSKYCLSKCGYFGESREWCITTKDLKWDYCSSFKRNHESSVPSKTIETHTIKGLHCESVCKSCECTSQFKCNVSKTLEYCAPPALSRIPVLPSDYNIGATKKGKCDDFLHFQSTGQVPNRRYEGKVSVPDDFLATYAEGIELTAARNDSVSSTFTVVNPTDPVERYTMVKINDIYVPAIVRAHVSKQKLVKQNVTQIPETVARKIQQLMSEDVEGYELENLIGTDIGGTNEEYNVVPMSSEASCAWYELSNAIRRWTRDTNGSVDILVVIFYHNENTPVPKGFGISLKFRNKDNSLFVACQEQVYWSMLRYSDF